MPNDLRLIGMQIQSYKKSSTFLSKTLSVWMSLLLAGIEPASNP